MAKVIRVVSSCFAILMLIGGIGVAVMLRGVAPVGVTIGAAISAVVGAGLFLILPFELKKLAKQTGCKAIARDGRDKKEPKDPGEP